MKGDEWFIASWKRRPYTAHDKRHITVEHRVVADNIPGVGVDIRHEIRCPDRGEPDWKPIEVWEFRDHGVDKITPGDRDFKAIPDGGQVDHENDRPPCTNCGTPLWGPMLKTKPLHDGEGHYYIGRCCPECGYCVGGIITHTERPLREEFREQAELDPAPERWDLEDVPTLTEADEPRTEDGR